MGSHTTRTYLHANNKSSFKRRRYCFRFLLGVLLSVRVRERVTVAVRDRVRVRVREGDGSSGCRVLVELRVTGAVAERVSVAGALGVRAPVPVPLDDAVPVPLADPLLDSLAGELRDALPVPVGVPVPGVLGHGVGVPLLEPLRVPLALGECVAGALPVALPVPLRVPLRAPATLADGVVVTRGDSLGDGDRATSDARLRPRSTGSPSTNTNDPLRPASRHPARWTRSSHSASPLAASVTSAVRCTPLSTRMLGTTPDTLANSAQASGGVAGA